MATRLLIDAPNAYWRTFLLGDGSCAVLLDGQGWRDSFSLWNLGRMVGKREDELLVEVLYFPNICVVAGQSDIQFLGSPASASAERCLPESLGAGAAGLVDATKFHQGEPEVHVGLQNTGGPTSAAGCDDLTSQPLRFHCLPKHGVAVGGVKGELGGVEHEVMAGVLGFRHTLEDTFGAPQGIMRRVGVAQSGSAICLLDL